MMASPRRLAVLNVVGLTEGLTDSGYLPRIRTHAHSPGHSLLRIQPSLPAVTSTVQATYLTGKPPSHHGIVANGWYERERSEHQFWKQSDRLVRGPKLWEALRESRSDFTCARLFWWNNMFSTVDVSITPRPIYCADGNKVFDVTAQPLSLRDEVKGKLGPFPFPQFWGPMAGIDSSTWIANSAKFVEEKESPDLSFVYLPHLDYDFQRWGPTDHRSLQALRDIDAIVGDLLDFYESRGVDVVILSEYGITSVDQPVHLNRHFREQGWLEIKNELGHEILELGACRAFAIADHQLAHIYVQDPTLKGEVEALLSSLDGVAQVLGEEGKWEEGLDHPRSGDLIAVSQPNAWFTYYFWEDDALAPDYARTVDIHRKPGYDPVELFVDPDLRLPKIKAGKKLLAKKLGFRTLFDLIPLDASLIKGSHGALPKSKQDWPVVLGPLAETASPEIPAEEVYQQLHSLLSS
ncbi:MAG: nucleotide pyrophosphatase/phosphodiesterase family protein [Verrucomicrobiota bacterium]